MSIPPAAAAPASAPAVVTLSRTDATDVGQRQIYVRLDDGPTRKLVFGDSYTSSIPAGRHRLRVNNTLFWKSAFFIVEPGERVEFVLVNGAGAFAAGMLAILGVAPLSLVIEERRLGRSDRDPASPE
jgi:hypothetical protein